MKPAELIETEKELLALYGRRMNLSKVCSELGIKNAQRVKDILATYGVKALNLDGTVRYKTTDIANLIYWNEERTRQ